MAPPSAIAEHVAGPLGLDVVSAAAGIIEVVDVTMAAGVREVSVRRGFDARSFPLVVAGGAGPVHAAAIARELDIPLLLVPRESSIFCASGMLMCDFKHDYVRALKRPLEGAGAARFEDAQADGAGNRDFSYLIALHAQRRRGDATRRPSGGRCRCLTCTARLVSTLRPDMRVRQGRVGRTLRGDEAPDVPRPEGLLSVAKEPASGGCRVMRPLGQGIADPGRRRLHSRRHCLAHLGGTERRHVAPRISKLHLRD